MKSDVFISYRNLDLAFAEKLRQRLEAAGIKVWLDRQRLIGGEEFSRAIADAVDTSRCVVPVLTPNWGASLWTRFETYGANAVIPVRFQGNFGEVTPPPLRRLHQRDVTKDSEEEWRKLIGEILQLRNQEPPIRAEHFMQLRVPANPFFVGREEELTRMHEALFATSSPDATSGGVFVVSGGPGFGKSSLARQYVEKFWRCYQQIFWIDCREDIVSQFGRIAEQLKPVASEGDEEHRDARRLAERAREELNQWHQRPSRLLVLDDAWNESDVAWWIPTGGPCHTIVTARLAAERPKTGGMTLTVFDAEPARQLLFDRTKRNRTPANIAACDELANELERVPLALEQAAAYINQQEMSFGFENYLGLCRTTTIPQRLPVEGATHYRRSLYATWQIAIERLPPESRAMVRLLSFMAPAPVPLTFLFSNELTLTKGAAQLVPCASAMTVAAVSPEAPAENSKEASEATVREWLRVLVGYAMVKHEPDGSVSVFKPVWSIERDLTPEPERVCWRAQAQNALRRFVPLAGDDSDNWPTWRQILPHARAIQEHVQHRGLEPDIALSGALAAFLYSQGCSAEAETPARQAARSAQNGDRGVSSLSYLDLLATVLRENRKFDEAEAYYRQVHEATEATLPPSEPLRRMVLSHLAGLLTELGKYRDAEALYLKCIELCHETVGATARDTLEAANNLGCLFQKTGRHAEAERIHRNALADYMNAHNSGSTHRDAIAMTINLAAALEGQGRWQEAEEQYRKALAASAKAMPTNEHPLTIRCATNLALCLLDQGNVAEAETLCQQAQMSAVKVFGEEDPKTAAVIALSARIAMAHGEFAEAERLYRRASSIYLLTLGPNHPETLIGENNVADAIELQGRIDDAISCLRRALGYAENGLGNAHEVTLTLRHNLAFFLNKYGDVTSAESLVRAACEGRKELLRPLHPDTAQSVRLLAVVLACAGRVSEAVSVLAEYLCVLVAGGVQMEATQFVLTCELYEKLLICNQTSPEAAREIVSDLIRRCAASNT